MLRLGLGLPLVPFLTGSFIWNQTKSKHIALAHSNAYEFVRKSEFMESEMAGCIWAIFGTDPKCCKTFQNQNQAEFL